MIVIKKILNYASTVIIPCDTVIAVINVVAVNVCSSSAVVDCILEVANCVVGNCWCCRNKSDIGAVVGRLLWLMMPR
jgi:hypothetical protein